MVVHERVKNHSVLEHIPSFKVFEIMKGVCKAHREIVFNLYEYGYKLIRLMDMKDKLLER